MTLSSKKPEEPAGTRPRGKLSLRRSTNTSDEYIRRRKQIKLIERFGTVDFDPAYDYKAERRRRHS
ncbi:MAG TPA: hypothetical protein VJ731_18985 [Terriglobales bacterium]|nr:hypothetical protein [Terriglobales bacterium]